MFNAVRTITEIVAGVLVCFVGLFIIMAVSASIPIAGSSAFYSSYTGLNAFVGTFMAVLGLVMILHGLFTAIKVMQSNSGAEESAPGHHGGFA